MSKHKKDLPFPFNCPSDSEDNPFLARLVRDERVIRDGFAGKAMQGLIEHYGQSDGKEPLARQAYEIADAMMLERAK